MPINEEKFLSMADTINMDLEEDVVVDQTASHDTITVMWPCISHGEAHFSGQCIFAVLLRLKLFPQDQPALLVNEALLISTWVTCSLRTKFLGPHVIGAATLL